ncbi:hypothetical protein [Pseudomonas sp. TWR2-1-1]|uniref:hypothetical protein n=1 Tax=Pseudomonas sp. TWR2-1-1 TaxID=2804610 RepID=UPI003CF486DB
MSAGSTDESPSGNSTIKEYALKVFSDGKWWGVLFGTMAAILTLSKYLWVIGHPELLLKSIDSIQNLLVWLFSIFIGLCGLLTILAFPSIIFSVIVSPFKLKPSNTAKLAMRFVKVVWVGFIWLTLSLILSEYIETPTWIILLIAYAIALTGSIWALSFTSAARNRYMKKAGRGHGIVWCFIHEKRTLICIASLIWLTALTGVFPAQITLLAWRGPDQGIEEFQVIPYCFISMLLSTLPIIAFYAMPGSPLRRYFKVGISLVMVVFLTLLMLPAALDLWVYSAANMLKLRDNRPLSYLVDPKDYPRSTFQKELWQVEDTDSPDNAFLIKAFKLYELGGILLLCPERYTNKRLRELSEFTNQCFTTSPDKVKISAPRLPQKQNITHPSHSPNCVSAQGLTRAPMKIVNTRSCLFHRPI